MFNAYNTTTGALVRAASTDEIANWLAGQTHPMFLAGVACFDHAVVVGDVSVQWVPETEYQTGYQSWDWV